MILFINIGHKIHEWKSLKIYLEKIQESIALNKEKLMFKFYEVSTFFIIFIMNRLQINLLFLKFNKFNS